MDHEEFTLGAPFAGKRKQWFDATIGAGGLAI
jgi:hypothetical protein